MVGWWYRRSPLMIDGRQGALVQPRTGGSGEAMTMAEGEGTRLLFEGLHGTARPLAGSLSAGAVDVARAPTPSGRSPLTTASARVVGPLEASHVRTTRFHRRVCGDERGAPWLGGKCCSWDHELNLPAI